MPDVAPVALFAYNRPGLFEQAVLALRENSESRLTDLHVFSDGPKGKTDEPGVMAVRQIAKEIEGFRSVTLHERPSNLGLAQSVISGVDYMLRSSETVIVLEDDLVTSPFFLRFMNEALARFVNDERVGSVHGYIYPLRPQMDMPFFLRGADCWGWATWRRSWRLYNCDSRVLLKRIRAQGLVRSFNLNNSHGYSRMLRDEAKGRVKSWAIQWHASLFLAGKLTLYPNVSLVTNIGVLAGGTNMKAGETDDFFKVDLAQSPISFEGVKVEESEIGRKRFELFFRQMRQQSFSIGRISRLLARLKTRWEFI